MPRAAWVFLPVRPELLRWHRQLVRRRWAAFGRRRGPGRPALPAHVLEAGLTADEVDDLFRGGVATQPG